MRDRLSVPAKERFAENEQPVLDGLARLPLRRCEAQFRVREERHLFERWPVPQAADKEEPLLWSLPRIVFRAMNGGPTDFHEIARDSNEEVRGRMFDEEFFKRFARQWK